MIFTYHFANLKIKTKYCRSTDLHPNPYKGRIFDPKTWEEIRSRKNEESPFLCPTKRRGWALETGEKISRLLKTVRGPQNGKNKETKNPPVSLDAENQRNPAITVFACRTNGHCFGFF
jgi:hypothetical protein